MNRRHRGLNNKHMVRVMGMIIIQDSIHINNPSVSTNFIMSADFLTQLLWALKGFVLNFCCFRELDGLPGGTVSAISIIAMVY